jgi:anti-anti-sigma factor
MRIKEETHGDVRILKLSGEFDTADVPVVAARLVAARGARARRLVVNLREVRFATAAAVGCLVAARAKARGDAGDLVVSAPSRPVGRLVRALKLGRALPAYPDDAAALAHYRGDVALAG